MTAKKIIIVAILISFFPLVEIAAARQRDQYYAVYIQGERAGYARRTRQVADELVTTTEKVVMEIARAGISVKTQTTETSVETVDGQAVSFGAVEQMSMMETTIRGKIANGVADVVTESFGQKQQQQIDWPEGAVMAEGLRLAVLETKLEPGSKAELKLFSPQLLTAVDTTVEVVGKEKVAMPGGLMELTKVRSTLDIPTAGSITTTSYLSDDVFSMRDEMKMVGMKIELVASSKEYALADADAPEIFLDAAVASPVAIDIENAESVTYTLAARDHADISQMAMPTDDNQTMTRDDNGNIILRVHPVDWPETAEFVSADEFQTYLQPSRYVQSDDPKIIELAEEAVSDATDAVEALRNIKTFAAEYITNPTWTVGYASASEVAQNRSGDCTEYAVLTTALCRAAGIPAQVVMGVVYVDEPGFMEQSFAGHAWVRAYVGDRWVGLDPAFVSELYGDYGPGHIAMSFGGDDPQSFLELWSIMGNFDIKEVQVK